MNIQNVFSDKLTNKRSASWVDIRTTHTLSHLSAQYEDICQEHELNKKWILMINPEIESLDALTKSTKVDISKILKVDTNKTKIDLKNIESALCNGNCSAVILCNPSLRSEELIQLNECAEKGKTACIVLTNNQKLH